MDRGRCMACTTSRLCSEHAKETLRAVLTDLTPMLRLLRYGPEEADMGELRRRLSELAPAEKHAAVRTINRGLRAR